MGPTHAVTRIHIIDLAAIRAFAEMDEVTVPVEIHKIVEEYRSTHPNQKVVVLPHLAKVARGEK